MKILVTGNQGYIGTHAAAHLVKQGYEVVGMDSGFYKDCNLSVITSDVFTNQKDIRDVEIQDFSGVDAVVHLAALSNDPLGELDSSLTCCGTFKSRWSFPFCFCFESKHVWYFYIHRRIG